MEGVGCVGALTPRAPPHPPRPAPALPAPPRACLGGPAFAAPLAARTSPHAPRAPSRPAPNPCALGGMPGRRGNGEW